MFPGVSWVTSGDRLVTRSRVSTVASGRAAHLLGDELELKLVLSFGWVIVPTDSHEVNEQQQFSFLTWQKLSQYKF